MKTLAVEKSQDVITVAKENAQKTPLTWHQLKPVLKQTIANYRQAYWSQYVELLAKKGCLLCLMDLEE